MIAKEYINSDLPFLDPSDSVDRAITYFEESKTAFLPVVKDRKYLGLVEEQLLLNLPDFSIPIEDTGYLHKNVYVEWHEHIYNVFQQMTENQVSLVPILDQNKAYIGAIDQQSATVIVSQLSAAKSTGGIVILSMNQNDYSLSSIARIAESNNLKILSAHIITDFENPVNVNLNLKLNKDDISALIADFERHDYTIAASFQKDEIDVNMERLEQFFKYLDL